MNVLVEIFVKRPYNIFWNFLTQEKIYARDNMQCTLQSYFLGQSYPKIPLYHECNVHEHSKKITKTMKTGISDKFGIFLQFNPHKILATKEI